MSDALAAPLHLASTQDLMTLYAKLTRRQDALSRRWSCSRPGCNGLPHAGWGHRHARASQRRPDGPWTTWLIMAGRGWGKTRTAAEAVREWINEAGRPLQVAVIARNDVQLRQVCFEQRRSGLLAVFPEDEIERYDRRGGSVALHLTNGSVIRGFGATQPDNFRGYEFDKVWGDEYAAWPRHVAQETLDTVWFCLRESDSAQVVLSTTPKPLPHIKKLLREHDEEVAEIAASDDPDRLPTTRITRGHMRDNRDNLSEDSVRQLERSYEGTRLGRQELAGDFLEDVEGALWQGWILEADGFRVLARRHPDLERVVVAVDPAVTSGEGADESGFAVVGRTYPYPFQSNEPDPHGYVLASQAERMTPHQTMQHAARLYHQHRADAVVIEANNGGDYLAALLGEVDPRVRCRIVHATRDKRARAAPVAALYERGRMHHVGDAKTFDALEQTMTTYVGAPERHEKSPDILDALVWACWDLFLDRRAAPPINLGTRDTRL